ncbi:MAG: DUF4411 family protein [Planctomycetes bacterium]|nr:DUF4411 family protein [Planctomycetota bacterium]
MMYVFDTNVFISLGMYYPSRFPTIWKHINNLVGNDKLVSTREVFKELDQNCADEHIEIWANKYKNIFLIPTNEECAVVAEIFRRRQHQDLVKRNRIQRGMPVADPFVIALAKVKNGCVVTQESPNRMPAVCENIGVDCINLEQFLGREDLAY